jgi:dipeptidyl aminopeptidase/acylaminoacyl peptidase
LVLSRLLRGAALLSAFLTMPARADADRVPGAADYAASPAIADPTLSPDGQRVAARTRIDGQPRLALFDLARAGAVATPVALPQDQRLEWFFWLDANRLLVSLSGHRGAADVTRLMAVDLRSGALAQIGAERPGGAGDEIVHVDRAGGFLLLKRQGAESESPSIYRVDLRSGATTLAVEPRAGVWDWLVDSAGVVRAGMGAKGGKSWMLYRRGEGERFSRAGRGADRSGIDQLSAVQGSDQGYALAATRSGRTGLFTYDFRKGRLGGLVYENPEVDLDGFQTGADGRVTGVDFTLDRHETHWLDPLLAKRQAAVDAALPGRTNRVLSASADQARLLVLSESASDPGAYYLVAGGHAALLAEINPALHGVPAGTMRAVRYRARDGLEIRGYLTLPPGRAATGLPLIVMPHGGPFARDEWGYDPWVQYLASKGYAVLQPNFRGSTGFGDRFVAQGDGQWGRGMQDDIDDGVKWLAAQGTADAKRVCIMGASFGGYAAMWAAVRNPDLYRCAISFAGISDVKGQLDYDHKTFDERDFRIWRRRIQGDARSLESLSPLNFVAQMKVPILIGHGTADEVVPPDQSERLHQALARLGRAHGYVAYPGEGHSMADPAHEADFLGRVGAFLDANNPS